MAESLRGVRVFDYMLATQYTPGFVVHHNPRGVDLVLVDEHKLLIDEESEAAGRAILAEYGLSNTSLATFPLVLTA